MDSKRFPIVRKVDDVLVRVCRFCTKIGAIIIVLIMLLAFCDTLMAKLFSNSIPHATELIQYLNVPAVFMGMAYMQLVRRHTVVELVSTHLPHVVQSICTFLWDIAGVAFSGVSAWRGIVLTINKFSIGELSGQVNGFPLWPFALTMAIGWALLAVAFLWCAIRIAIGYEKIWASGEQPPVKQDVPAANPKSGTN